MKDFLFLVFSVLMFTRCASQINSNSNKELNNSTSSPTTNFFQPSMQENSYNLDSTTIEIRSNKAKKQKYESISKDKISRNQQLNISYKKIKSTASHQSFQRTPNDVQQTELDNLSNEMMRIEPNGFESNLNYYSSGNYDIEREPNLRKAQTISPNHVEVLKFVAANAIIKGDINETKTTLTKLNEIGALSNESISYAEDMVSSSCGNSTLITHGYNDTYAAHYVQLENIQSCDDNLTIISLDFLQSGEYKKNLEKKGYVIPSKKVVNTTFLKEFCEKNGHKKIAISMTLPKPYLQTISEKLYPSGIVFEYGLQPRTSIETLDGLWFKHFNRKVVFNYQTPLSNSLAANYLPMLFYLNSYYKSQRNEKKCMEIEQEINRIKVKAGLKNKK